MFKALGLRQLTPVLRGTRLVIFTELVFIFSF